MGTGQMSPLIMFIIVKAKHLSELQTVKDDNLYAIETQWMGVNTNDIRYFFPRAHGIEIVLTRGTLFIPYKMEKLIELLGQGDLIDFTKED